MRIVTCVCECECDKSEYFSCGSDCANREAPTVRQGTPQYAYFYCQYFAWRPIIYSIHLTPTTRVAIYICANGLCERIYEQATTFWVVGSVRILLLEYFRHQIVPSNLCVIKALLLCSALSNLTHIFIVGTKPSDWSEGHFEYGPRHFCVNSYSSGPSIHSSQRK